ncbi:MAG: hypothetical protein FJ278_04980, partial [Planctomycetes bacterium]|nr:hypothetical protein [Planctomycetota bacterium]
MAWLTLLLALVFVHVAAQAAPDPLFENLGQPVRTGSLPLYLVTQDAGGRHVAWGALEGADERALVGIRV